MRLHQRSWTYCSSVCRAYTCKSPRVTSRIRLCARFRPLLAKSARLRASLSEFWFDKKIPFFHYTERYRPRVVHFDGAEICPSLTFGCPLRECTSRKHELLCRHLWYQSLRLSFLPQVIIIDRRVWAGATIQKKEHEEKKSHWQRCHRIVGCISDERVQQVVE